MSTHLTIEEVLTNARNHEQARANSAHVRNEESCHEQAKRELAGQGTSGIDYIRRTLRRAQEIKLERLAR
jgi:hypothetical protein